MPGPKGPGLAGGPAGAIADGTGHRGQDPVGGGAADEDAGLVCLAFWPGLFSSGHFPRAFRNGQDPGPNQA